MVLQILAMERPDWAMPERPNMPKVGDIWMESIEFIMDNLPSVDGATPGNWERVVGYKRTDDHYPAVVESLTVQGWKHPLGMVVGEGGDLEEFGDGHHRLLAAYQLGLTHVPVRAFENAMDSVDSDYHADIHDNDTYWADEPYELAEYDPENHQIHNWGVPK